MHCMGFRKPPCTYRECPLPILRGMGTESIYFTYTYQGTERNKYIGRVHFENLKVRVRNFFELMVRVRERERADFPNTGTESR